ncbi:uncharacterized protein LOC115232105 [Octopus sinensis]|uniref:Uncharacterized protein LOC115232105 n=1 Tax=Octopus sinensis TaxID=2607531 RepID=A0A6P7U655_9MOLL|nr:uncharacterized protein LOC115232105 [Octopus sinensis]
MVTNRACDILYHLEWPKKPKTVNNEDFVIVSAFYNLGEFLKPIGIRKPSQYYEWIYKYEFVKNHIVFFSDSKSFLDQLLKVRKGKQTTAIYLSRWELIGFKNIQRIKEIFTLPGYGKHPLQTGNSQYSAFMHSKHELIERAIRMFSNTSLYFAWADVGLLRNTDPQMDYSFTTSKYIDNNSIFLSQVKDFHEESMNIITKDAREYVAGGMFVGHAKVFLQFCETYKKLFYKLLDLNLIATDEKALYILFTREGRALVDSNVNMHVYNCGFFGFYTLFSNVKTTDKCDLREKP